MGAESEMEVSRKEFQKQDQHVFEWLYILEEYRGDILDSLLHTLSHLQYEFFSASAHAFSTVLPNNMEFRPMAEMIPDCLEAQVEIELKEPDEFDGSFSGRFIERLARDSKCAEPVVVDPLSLSSLMSQGFEDGQVRRALRLHQNNTQEALDWLIRDGTDDRRLPGSRTSTTLDQVLSWDEVRSQM